MIPRLESARYTAGYRIYLRFADGRQGEADLEQELWGEAFEPLRDPAVFRSFKLDHELNTLVWPGGADLAPEYLYAAVGSPDAESGNGHSAIG